VIGIDINLPAKTARRQRRVPTGTLETPLPGRTRLTSPDSWREIGSEISQASALPLSAIDSPFFAKYG